jgi:hypothetical protein
MSVTQRDQSHRAQPDIVGLLRETESAIRVLDGFRFIALFEIMVVDTDFGITWFYWFLSRRRVL